MIWLNSKLIILRRAVTNWRARGGCPFEPQQRCCIVASNKYLINCLVLVQPDFETIWVGEGFAIGWGCLVILGSH